MPKLAKVNNTLQLSEMISKEIQFLIICCQKKLLEEDIKFIQLYVKGENVNINTLIQLASKHGILPLVYKALKDLSTTQYPVSSEILSAFQKHFLSIVQRNMLMSAQLIHIMKLFQKNHIHFLAFKGPVLSQIAYGDITLRQYGDLDILVKKEDRSKAIALLIKENYIPEIALEKETKKTFFNAVNVLGLHHPSNGVFIEVHWELLSKNYAISWQEKSIWQHPASVELNRTAIPALPTEQLILYLCVHGSKHLFERVEWICDIDRTLKANPDTDWQYLLQEAEKLGITRMLYLGLTLSQLLFHLKLPSDIEQNIKKDTEIPKLIAKILEINFSENSQQGKSYSSFALLWSMRENLSDRLRFTLRGLFAPKFDDFAFIQLPKHFAFLYPVIRPYRLITKYFKN